MKKIIVMGASSGIGKAFAETLLEHGIKVGVAARNTEKLRKMAEKYPGMVEYESIDVTLPQAKERLRRLIDKMGGVDLYFHVSGIGYENTTLDPEMEVKIFETNTIGFVRCICTVYNYMRDTGTRGRIAAVTSVAGTNGLARLSAYSGSKAGVQKWLVALQQLSNTTGAGISFTDIRPGWIKTPLLLADASYPMEMNLDYVIPLIIKAIVHKRRVAVIDWRWNLLVGLWRMVPNALYTLINPPVSLPDVSLPNADEKHDAAIREEDRRQERRDTRPK